MAEACTGRLSCDCALCIDRPENKSESDEEYAAQKQQEELEKQQAKEKRRAERKRQRAGAQPTTPPTMSAAPAAPHVTSPAAAGHLATPPTSAAGDSFLIADPPMPSHELIKAKEAAGQARKAKRQGARSSGPRSGREKNASVHQVSLAVTYQKDKDDPRIRSEDWVATEKYDGIRAVWVPNGPDPPHFKGRNGTPMNEAPPTFTALLPTDMVLDGELWAGRGKFDAVGSLMGTKSLRDDRLWEDAWGSLTFVVFDAPFVGLHLNYLERLAKVRERLAHVNSECVRVVTTLPCESAHDKDLLLERVTAAHGEGLVLRRVASRWRCGSEGRNLLKVKYWFDAEAEVISDLKPARTDRNVPTVRCLALNVVGLKDYEFDLPVFREVVTKPAKGDIVTFGYKDVTEFTGLTAGGRPTSIRLEKVHPEICDCDICSAR